MINEFKTALLTNDIKKIESLLRSGLDVNAIDSGRRSLLMHSVLQKNIDVEIVELLIAKGADVNAKDLQQSWTALHVAARDGNFEIANLLVNKNASINVEDIFGNTPLARGIFNYSGRPEIIKLLLNNGANPSHKNKSGVSPLALAKTMGNDELIQLLSKN